MNTHSHHTMRTASVDAFRERVATGKHQLDRDRISEYCLRAPGRVTRRMIARDLCMDTATVSGLVNPLVKAKVLHEFPDSEKAPCPVTGKNVGWLTHITRIKPQGELFGGVQ